MNQITYEPPRELNPKNIIYWSEHYKKLEGVEHGKGIQTKARLFVKNKCIEYDPSEMKYSDFGDYDGHKFICKPIKNYNSTTYRLWQNKDKSFECSCQFWNKQGKELGINCSHLTALWMVLKIWNWKRKKVINDNLGDIEAD